MRYLLFCLIILFFNYLFNREDCKININLQEGDSLKVYLQQWREDSSACLNLRNHEKSEYIRTKLDLDKKTDSQIINILGTPNSYFEDSTKIRISYIYGMICDKKNQRVDSSDFCWVEYKFSKPKRIVKEVSYGCL